MTVYVDVLLCINIFVNYLLLALTRRLLHNGAGGLRMLLSAGAGSLYSLIIFLPELSPILKLFANTGVIVLMVLVAFAPKNIKSFLKLFFAFIGVNFAFAGIMLAVWIFIAPDGMLYNNSVVYFDIDIKLLTVLSIVCYAVLRLVGALAKRTAPKDKTVSISFNHFGKCVTANALIDTGNSLKDGFTGAPVIIADESTVRALVGNSLYTLLDGNETDRVRIRLIPISTVSSGGYLAAFTVEEAVINNTQSFKNVIMAQSRTNIATDEYSVILNNDFFN